MVNASATGTLESVNVTSIHQINHQMVAEATIISPQTFNGVCVIATASFSEVSLLSESEVIFESDTISEALLDSDEALSDSEEALSDSEEALSDSEEALSDSEETLSDSEEALSDSDEALTDSEEAASEWEALIALRVQFQ